MSSPADFSVLVNSFNYKDFVVEAVESALAQSRAARQVIVVDDGSTDGSVAVLQERYGRDPRVTLVFGDNRGQLATVKRGLRHATGSVICFLDSDDRWRPDYLAKIGAVYDARPDVDFVFTDMRRFGEEDQAFRFAERDADFGFTSIIVCMMGYWYGAPTSALSLRSAWAHRTLDLPSSFESTWRFGVDCCLVYGASVLGARKYYLDTAGSAEYRIHGRNNSLVRRGSPEAKYVRALNKHSLIDHHARTVGITEMVGMTEAGRAVLKREFLTKPDPTWAEATRYANAALGKERNGLSVRRALRTWKLYRKRRRSK
jgi:glycosyltransferase involved in cell wall biosynthesis